jgi:hypothetical protein
VPCARRRSIDPPSRGAPRTHICPYLDSSLSSGSVREHWLGGGGGDGRRQRGPAETTHASIELPTHPTASHSFHLPHTLPAFGLISKSHPRPSPTSEPTGRANAVSLGRRMWSGKAPHYVAVSGNPPSVCNSVSDWNSVWFGTRGPRAQTRSLGSRSVPGACGGVG